jgi:chemotaxis signal transduction protein
MSELAHFEEKLAALRGEFDRSFALPLTSDAVRSDEYLILGIGATSYGVRLSDVGGIFSGRTITPLPSRHPEYLGLVGLRGVVHSVFDLGWLLGHGRTEHARWFLTCMTRRELALAFGDLHSLAQVPESDVVSGTFESESGSPAVRIDGVRWNGRVHPIVRIAPLIETLRSRILSSSPTSEESR